MAATITKITTPLKVCWIEASGPPTSSDNAYPLGSRWLDTVADRTYELVAGVAAVAIWIDATVSIADVFASQFLLMGA